MLYQFLIDNRETLLADTNAKIAGISKNMPTSVESEKGMPDFYGYLVRELRRESRGLLKGSDGSAAPKQERQSTAPHGQELSRLGYTVSQVVHGYGALCQAVTELAQDRNFPITAGEFSALNLTLDVAIADAVTGFSEHASVEGVDSAKRMGYLIHELRNSLAAALIAHAQVKKGVVGARGSTNTMLEKNLNHMRDLLDRSFSEVRMRHDKEVDMEPVLLLGVIEEVEAAVGEQARLLGLTIEVKGLPMLQVAADRHYLVSALSNLVQNAIKYSKRGGVIRMSCRETNKNAVLEVEDYCGGLPRGKAEELFKPRAQKGTNRAGLGLGLTISRQAVSLIGGVLAVQDIPGKGCLFSINLPRKKNSPWQESGEMISHPR